jgi:glutaredoxin
MPGREATDRRPRPAGRLGRVAASLALLAVTACGRDAGTRAAGEDARPGAGDDGGPSGANAGLPALGPDAGTRFVYTWTDEDGAFRVARSRDEIPAARREVVRVQDTQRPPAAGRVLIADLREPQGGHFPLREVGRDEYLALVGRARPTNVAAGQAAGPAVPDAGAAPARADAAAPRVVMYMTSHCPVCHRARTWLTQQGVAFVERNVERDEAAARDLATLAARQGVSARGVPVFDIGGRLVAGFDEQALRRALGR